MKLRFDQYPAESRVAKSLTDNADCQSPIMIVLPGGFFAILNRHYSNQRFFAIGPDGVCHMAQSDEDPPFTSSDTEGNMFRAVVRHLGTVYKQTIPSPSELFARWKDGGGNLGNAHYIYDQTKKEWINARTR